MSNSWQILQASFLRTFSFCYGWGLILGMPGWSETPATSPDSGLDLNPEVVESSPTLQRWQKAIPDLQQEINQDPSFRTRWRWGYNQFPSSSHSSGLGVGVTDLWVGNTALTVDGQYATNFGSRQSLNLNLNYYLLPLGYYANVAPSVGYGSMVTGDYSTDGINVGGKVTLALSRTGAADIVFSQNFIAPGSANEVGISTLSVGYAIAEDWRISTDLQQQNSITQKDNRAGFYLEWMP